MPILSPIGAATSGAFGLPKSAGASTDPYYEYVTMLLNGDGTNGGQNNTFLDSSTNNFTITRNGNTTQGSFTPYSSYWSNYLSAASGTYFTAPYQCYSFGTGDFTIDGWFYKTSTTSQNVIGCGQAGTNYFVVATDSDGYVRFYATASGGGTPITSTGTWTVNQWNYFSIIRSSGTVTVNVNGVAGTGSSNTLNINSSSFPFVVGGYTFSEAGRWGGYVSNLRLSNIARPSYAVPTAPFTADANTTLLVSGVNRFKDSSSNNYAITVNNSGVAVQRFSPFEPTAAYDTAVNGGSGIFQGGSDNLNMGVNSAFSFGTGNDFCWEAWAYPNTSNPQAWISAHQPGQADGYYAYMNPPRLEVYSGGGGGSGVTSSTTPTQYSWNHVVITRQSGVFRVFLNGVMTGYSTNNKQVNQDGRSFCLCGNDSWSERFQGYLSNVRICNGSVPTSYQTSATSTGTAVFTPPTSPVTTSSQGAANVVFLANMANAAIPDYAMMNDLQTVGNAQISTSVKKFGTGSIAFDGTGDYLYSPDKLAAYFGTGNFTIECWLKTSSTGSYKSILVPADVYSVSGFYNFIVRSDNTIALEQGSGATLVQSTTQVTDGNWHHVAACRSGTTTRIFVDGVLEGTLNSDSYSYGINSVGNYVGTYQPSVYNFNGYIDDLRITKGYARYTASFTPPTAALPTY